MKKDLKGMAYYYNSLIEGDTHLVDEAFELMKKYNFVDENNEWIYEEDE